MRLFADHFMKVVKIKIF